VSGRSCIASATRSKDFFQDKDALWISYVLLDTKRIAAMLGMPMIHPQPDPIVQNYETKEIPEYQPYIWQLTRLGQAAAEAGKSLDFYVEVSRTIYTTPRWNEGDHLARAATRAGLDLAALDTNVTADPKRLDQVIEANQNALHAAGHWGVPTMVF
jgi:2-hydroxychromene-2-carboxylate isomerase